MFFIVVMILTTTCVAGAAAFFSVYGLAHTFTAAFWSVVVMGGSLEAGKLMITSYLYRFGDNMSLGRKWLGIIFVFGLMMITSLGIYGYLADAYQSGTTNMKQIGASLALKKDEQTTLQRRKADIDNQVASVPDKDVRGKQRLMSQFGPEVTTINKRLIEITKELQQDAQSQIVTDSHVGPIVFIAKILGLDPDRAMNYFILFIIFMFDPVAIYLTVATNEAIAKYKRREHKVTNDKAFVPTVNDPLTTTTQETNLPKELSQPNNLTDAVAAPINLQEVFADHPIDEVEAEPNIAPFQGLDIDIEELSEAVIDDPIETIKDIYEDVKSKDTQTPLDKETVNMIERFFARQQLVKDVRTGNVKQ